MKWIVSRWLHPLGLSRGLLKAPWRLPRVERLEGRLAPAAVPVGDGFRVDSSTTREQESVVVGMNANGDFVIAWQGVFQDGSGFGICEQRHNALGASQGPEFQVNTYTTNLRSYPAVPQSRRTRTEFVEKGGFGHVIGRHSP